MSDVEQLAADLLEADEFWDTPERANINTGWGAKQVHVGRGADHSGDCTKMPWTCQRCIYDEVTARARFLAARGWALQPE